MSQQKVTPKYWRSLESRDGAGWSHDPVGVSPLDGSFDPIREGIDRRRFIGLMGASSALAGLTMTGCIRKPAEKILPHNVRPENLIPGKPRHYATSALIGGGVQGLLVESHDGRPTRVDGNPDHPMNQGATNAWGQASVLNLYDPDRSQSHYGDGKKRSTEELEAYLKKLMSQRRADKGKGLALLIEWRPSPTFRRLLARFEETFPEAKIYIHDEAYPRGLIEGMASLGVGDMLPHYELKRANTILSVDADPLGTEGDAVLNSRRFGLWRQFRDQDNTMNRLYAVEPGLTVTGAAADHRLRLPAHAIPEFMRHLFMELRNRGAVPPKTFKETGGALGGDMGPVPFDKKMVKVWSADLFDNRRGSLVIVGKRQPARVHALAHAMNESMMNNHITTLYYRQPTWNKFGDLKDLTEALNGGEASTLIMLGPNPVYTAPASLGFEEALKKASVSIHHGLHRDETARSSTWHVAGSHFLESWGDWQSSENTTSIQQPLIAPLYDTVSELELLARIVSEDTVRGYELVRNTWKGFLADDSGFESKWSQWLHDGVTDIEARRPMKPPFNFSRVGEYWKGHVNTGLRPPKGLEVNFFDSNQVFDGRYANNAWLQELPDPIAKLTWDNAALMSPKTAGEYGIAHEPKSQSKKEYEMAEIQIGDRVLELPVMVIPGIADGTISIAMGYGRRGLGSVAEGAGFDANALRSWDEPYSRTGATLRRTYKKYVLASTQDHWLMGPDREEASAFKSYGERAIVRESDKIGYEENPTFALDQELMPADKLKSLWEHPNETEGQQWGMQIDLSACTGCGACTIACQSENNIPVVGKDQVARGREMSWIRIDRYFVSNEIDPSAIVEPRVVHQPVACAHCETAPCENVCPVAATSHSPEGLNDMAYNRCIGTRYCANNCPYKVRRFNFLNYNFTQPKWSFWDDDKKLSPIERMQKNPDVSVRIRGVMEKCTYCVQRINEAKIAAKNDGRSKVKDGDIVTACQQTCPTQAIVFGDLSDPESRASKMRQHNRNYALLSELNIHPRTTYLAKIRNRNPRLR